MVPVSHAEIRGCLTRWIASGNEIFSDGTELIGRVPSISPYAWFHELFAPPPDPNYDQLLRHIPDIFEFEIGKLLPKLNGLNLFSSNLFIYGLRQNYRRDGSAFQPWEISTHHSEQLNNLCGRKAIVFGGSHALPKGISYVENSDLSIEAYDRRDWTKPLRVWDNIHDFVRAEIVRLSLLFDDLGKPIDQRLLADFSIGS
jgi:hypothetical protein